MEHRRRETKPRPGMFRRSLTTQPASIRSLQLWSYRSPSSTSLASRSKRCEVAAQRSTRLMTLPTTKWTTRNHTQIPRAILTTSSTRKVHLQSSRARLQVRVKESCSSSTRRPCEHITKRAEEASLSSTGASSSLRVSRPCPTGTTRTHSPTRATRTTSPKQAVRGCSREQT